MHLCVCVKWWERERERQQTCCGIWIWCTAHEIFVGQFKAILWGSVYSANRSKTLQMSSLNFMMVHILTLKMSISDSSWLRSEPLSISDVQPNINTTFASQSQPEQCSKKSKASPYKWNGQFVSSANNYQLIPCAWFFLHWLWSAVDVNMLKTR